MSQIIHLDIHAQNPEVSGLDALRGENLIQAQMCCRWGIKFLSGICDNHNVRISIPGIGNALTAWQQLFVCWNYCW